MHCCSNIERIFLCLQNMDGNNAEMALKTKAAKQWIHRFKFVGRQEDIWSLAGTSRMVQSVYGVAGVGKSYIVKHVYYKQVINPKNFNKFGWVDVLHPFFFEKGHGKSFAMAKNLLERDTYKHRKGKTTLGERGGQRKEKKH